MLMAAWEDARDEQTTSGRGRGRGRVDGGLWMDVWTGD
jgi:hypothetical protein